MPLVPIQDDLALLQAAPGETLVGESILHVPPELTELEMPIASVLDAALPDEVQDVLGQLPAYVPVHGGAVLAIVGGGVEAHLGGHMPHEDDRRNISAIQVELLLIYRPSFLRRLQRPSRPLAAERAEVPLPVFRHVLSAPYVQQLREEELLEVRGDLDVRDVRHKANLAQSPHEEISLLLVDALADQVVLRHLP